MIGCFLACQGDVAVGLALNVGGGGISVSDGGGVRVIDGGFEVSTTSPTTTTTTAPAEGVAHMPYAYVNNPK